MSHSALLACLSPPRLSLWRFVFPDDACSGLGPHRAANAAFDVIRSGFSPAVTSSFAAEIGPMLFAEELRDWEVISVGGDGLGS